jgi:hypothetical protein
MAQGPTMQQLIDIAFKGAMNLRPYYQAILRMALKETGPVAENIEDNAVAVQFEMGGGLGPSAVSDAKTVIRLYRMAQATLVPTELLKHFVPANRGEEFPPNIPFDPLTQEQVMW